MKIIRTALFTVLSTLILLPCLTSCSDDDNKFSWDKAENMLIGQWELEEDLEIIDDRDIIMTLNANHTGNVKDKYKILGNFTWSYDTPGHILTFTTEGQPAVSCEVKSVSCCELTLQLPDEATPRIFEREN